MRPMGSILPLASFLVLVALASIVLAQTDPPSTQGDDWVVEDVSYWGEDLTLAGNLSVNNSGSLKLDDMVLIMDPAVDGGLTIFVEAGSYLELANVTLRSSDPNLHFWFEAEGKLVIVDSDVRDVASNGGGSCGMTSKEAFRYTTPTPDWSGRTSTTASASTCSSAASASRSPTASSSMPST